MINNLPSIIEKTLTDPPIFKRKANKTELKKNTDVYFEIIDSNTFCFFMIKSIFNDFLKHRLFLHFKRESLILDCKVETNSCDIIKYTICIKEDIKKFITVDGNKTLILLNGEKHKINKERIFAENLKTITHFTSTDKLINILHEKSFIASNLSKFSSEKGFSVSKESAKTCFASCFTRVSNKDSKMWNDFKDNEIKANNDRCRIDIYLYSDTKNLFNLQDPIGCLIKNKRKFKEIGILHNSIFSNSAIKINGIFLEQMIRPVKYENIQNYVNQEINGEDFIIIDNIARNVNLDFSYQKEIRYIFFLRSVKELRLQRFDYIKLPLNFGNIKKIVITINPFCSVEQRSIIKNKLSKCISKLDYSSIIKLK